MAWDRRNHYGRTRIGSALNVVIATIIVLVSLYIGATRNPIAYGVTVVAAFMLMVFVAIAGRVWRGEDRDRR